MGTMRPPFTPELGSTLTLVVAEHLHAGLCVRVVGWFEAQLGDTWVGEADKGVENKAGGQDICPTNTGHPGLPAHPTW